MNLDPKNQLTTVRSVPKSQVNNVGAFLMDTLGFIGTIEVDFSIGTKTVGDADGAITLNIQHSATNNISNAVNYVATNVATTNNATNAGSISVDTRDCNRYLFYGATVTGTNSPAYPISVIAKGTKRQQPAG